MSTVWSCRSPIGISLAAQSQHVSPTNPHGLFGVSDTSDTAATIGAAIVHTQASIDNAVSIEAQGIYWHGFTAGMVSSQIEYQNPTPLPPELMYQVNGRDLLDELLDMVHSAGLRSGCLLTPHMPTGNFMTGEFHGMVLPRENPPSGQLSRSYIMSSRTSWARSRGMSIFYVDAHHGWSDGLALDYQQFADDNDECLFMFECLDGWRHFASHDPLYQWGLPWSKVGGHSTRRDAGLGTVHAISYHEDISGPLSDEDFKIRIRSTVNSDDIAAPFIHFQSRGLQLLQDVLAE